MLHKQNRPWVSTGTCVECAVYIDLVQGHPLLHLLLRVHFKFSDPQSFLCHESYTYTARHNLALESLSSKYHYWVSTVLTAYLPPELANLSYSLLSATMHLALSYGFRTQSSKLMHLPWLSHHSLFLALLANNLVATPLFSSHLPLWFDAHFLFVSLPWGRSMILIFYKSASLFSPCFI